MKESLKNILLKAGEIALLEQNNMTVDVKQDKSIVTNGDLAVSQFLEIELKKLYPDHDIFSEENTSQIPRSKKVIIIDPIDGTESYSRKQDSWSLLVGFLDDLNIVGGVVYQPSKETFYYGFKGQGAFKINSDGDTIKLDVNSNRKELKGISSPKDYGETQFLNSIGINDIERSYSAALKIMQIADGYADVYVNFRHKCSLWDLVAPVAILVEARGTIKYDPPLEYSLNNYHIDSNFCCFGKNINEKDIFKK